MDVPQLIFQQNGRLLRSNFSIHVPMRSSGPVMTRKVEIRIEKHLDTKFVADPQKSYVKSRL